MPNTEDDFRKKVVDVEHMWQYPCCWAAIDGCHIPIKYPPGELQSCIEYHNYKNFYSSVLMRLVDSKYQFIWESCGFPGNSHDAIIFQSTDLWSKIKENEILLQIGKDVGGVLVPLLILGESAFPLQPWLMKPFTNGALTTKQSYLNYRLSRGRMITERAYGQLKGRWRVLFRQSESSQEKRAKTTLVCMVLHNICIDQGDTILRALDPAVDPATNGRRDRDIIRKLLQMTSCGKIRDTMKHTK